MTAIAGVSAEAGLRRRLQAELLRGVVAGNFADDRTFAQVFGRVLAFQHRFGGTGGRRDPFHGESNAALPVELFKYRRLATFAPPAAGRFFSSGTTRGHGGRACHEFADFQLYEAALRRGFSQAVFGVDNLDRGWETVAPRWNLLVPAGASWWRTRNSSLAHMGRAVWLSLSAAVDARLHRIDPAAPAGEFKRALRALATASDGRVTLGFGTGFGFLHLADRLRSLRWNLRLHPHSRVMETGGYKGRGRELAPAALHATLAATFGLPVRQVFAEYGMTELSSQAYQVWDGPAPVYPELPVYRPAETLRVHAVDVAGRPCRPGQPGLLEVFDLMNLTSAARLLLGDIGVMLESGPAVDGVPARRRFQVLGRAQRLAARGCGLADDLRRMAGVRGG